MVPGKARLILQPPAHSHGSIQLRAQSGLRSQTGPHGSWGDPAPWASPPCERATCLLCAEGDWGGGVYVRNKGHFHLFRGEGGFGVF